MKIILIEGSNRGEESASFDYARRLMKSADKSFRFEILEVGKYIKVLEENRAFFDSYMDAVKESDAVIWLVPVRNLLPSYEICHFLYLIDSRNAGQFAENKYTTALFTSSFFSHRDAEAYLSAACQTWNMNYLRGYHCRPDAVFRKGEAQRWKRFTDEFFEKVRTQFPCEKFHFLSSERSLPFKPTTFSSVPQKESEKKVLLLTSYGEKNSNLQKMIETWNAHFPYPTEIVNLARLPLLFPCSGCMNCFQGGGCSVNDSIAKTVYPLYQDADAVIFASDICCGLFHPQVKLFLDRIFISTFLNRNKPKMTVYLFSGSLKNKISLEKYIRKKTILHGDRLVGIVSDEEKSAKQISDNIIRLATAVAERLENDLTAEEADSDIRLTTRFNQEVILPPTKPFALFRRSDHRAPRRLPFKLQLEILKQKLLSPFRRKSAPAKLTYLQALNRLRTATAEKKQPPER